MGRLPKIELVPIGEIIKNPDNPRIIKNDNYKRLVKSIKEFPEMLKIRTIVVDENNTILGGNMRYEACLELHMKEVPVVRASDLTEGQKKEFVIRDNVEDGEWDFDKLANEWDMELLELCGIDMVPLIGSTVEKIKQKDEELVPYKKIHVLISTTIDNFEKLSESLNEIKKIDGVEIEQSAN